MAEIRKHKPPTSAIAQALSAAMGEPIRPTAPGARPFDEDDAGPASSPGSSASAGRTASSAPVDPSQVGASTSWRGFTVSALPPRTRPKAGDDVDDADDGDV